MVENIAKTKSKKAAAKPKAAKKISVKKTSAKKKASPKVSEVKKGLKKTITPEQYFYLRNGLVLRSVNELARVMDEIEDEVFNHHVNDERHDFASWINDVFEEAELARQLRESEKDKQKNHYIILKYIIKR